MWEMKAIRNWGGDLRRAKLKIHRRDAEDAEKTTKTILPPILTDGHR